MKKRILLAALVLAIGAVAAQAAEMTLFENPGLAGRQLTVRGYMPDINASGFNDHNASILVRSGTWEVCADANFRGFCATLQPGEYRSLDTRFNERIASAREIGGPVAEVAPPRYEPRYEPRGSIEMFGQTGFRGRALTLDHSSPNLDTLHPEALKALILTQQLLYLHNLRVARIYLRYDDPAQTCAPGVASPGDYVWLMPRLLQ